MPAMNLTIPVGQPRPIDIDYTHTYVGGVCVTSMVRDWEPGAWRRCTLCDVCAATSRDRCLVTVNFHVAPKDMALFSTKGMAVDGAGLRVV